MLHIASQSACLLSPIDLKSHEEIYTKIVGCQCKLYHYGLRDLDSTMKHDEEMSHIQSQS